VPALCGRLGWVPSESWGSKQAHRVIHQPVSVVSQCAAGAWLNGLASGDQRRLTGAAVHLRRVCDDALYKSTTTLLYFTCRPVLRAGRYRFARHHTVGLSISSKIVCIIIQQINSNYSTSIQCVYKKQTQLLLAQCPQTAAKYSNFWQWFRRQLRVGPWLGLPFHLCNVLTWTW